MFEAIQVLVVGQIKAASLVFDRTALVPTYPLILLLYAHLRLCVSREHSALWPLLEMFKDNNDISCDVNVQDFSLSEMYRTALFNLVMVLFVLCLSLQTIVNDNLVINIDT